MTNLREEIQRRRTFAIISHPDAGKTTLTEKLLLYGGAIREAGSVKSKKAEKYATSDWMEIEKQRGISVTSSAMQFDFDGFRINILDTPGHQDFSEDTYRTLTAVDSAVMLIDVAKGVEPQTIKLFKVCRMRGIPIFTFVNKMDRHGKELLDVLDEIEKVLEIQTYPMNWPVGKGNDFKGVYDRQSQMVHKFENVKGQTIQHTYTLDEAIDKFDQAILDELSDDLDLLDVAGNAFDPDQVGNGTLTPVFFGSAISNYGVQSFLERFISMSPSPQPRASDKGIVEPDQPGFSGFVFKIQANMNPDHRDRMAFLRICSGSFEKGMQATHARTSKSIRLAQPQQFMAHERDIISKAYPGDIIGLYDPGVYRIGDTLCTDDKFEYEPLPQFAPELFARITPKDAMRYKQYHKGLDQLIEEGAIQRFDTFLSITDDIVLGAVGQLQFEVLTHRLLHEYKVEIKLHHLSHKLARWVDAPAEFDPATLPGSQHMWLKDQNQHLVILFETEFAFRWAQDKHANLRFFPSAYELEYHQQHLNEN